MTEIEKAKLEGALWMAKCFCKQHSDALAWMPEDHRQRRSNEVDFEDKSNVVYYIENIIKSSGFVPNGFKEQLLSSEAVEGYDDYVNGDEDE